ncbi:endopeptidase La [Natranaerofaba carboxydovora]|uniref:endopeptidase La n=1 Tax=Natranaerofaba carboxydovora TaxID=2742683 RepID=UPI003B84626D
MPLRGILVFPNTVLHLDVGRECSITALEKAMVEGDKIFLTTQKNPEIDEPRPEDLNTFGTVAKIKQMTRLSGKNIRVLVEGVRRGRIVKYTCEDPFYRALIEEYSEEDEKEIEPNSKSKALYRSVRKHFDKYVKLDKSVPKEVVESVDSINDPGKISDIIAGNLNLNISKKQEILETLSIGERLEKVNEILVKEIEVYQIEQEINKKIKEQLEKSQREHYLREQLKAIKKELGEAEDGTSEIDDYKKKINEANMPEVVKDKLAKEVGRLEKMPPSAAEGMVIRNYLDWVLSLPWEVKSKEKIDLNETERILEEDHYGLKKVKERIIEYLAVKELSKDLKGPIICFVGPPGVGKTSLAKSIARSLDREYIRVSLGGVRDEAEIKGHRKTYVGAMPGRIIQGIRQAGTKNPVFLLDEIDKMTRDFRGDPSAALLEILDPQQNKSYSDHFIEIPFDLSEVMFITTANALYNIPAPLVDRMEVIDIQSYTEEEKLEIAKKYLLPRQIKEHGLKENQIILSESALKKIIREYTREAGVRNLERELAALCRKIAKITAKDSKSEVSKRITLQNLEKYLGVPRYRYGAIIRENEVGVCTGVSWTETGGDILEVEVNLVKGKGNLTLTGQLGDVMQESAQAALSYVRSLAGKLNIDENIFESKDIHIHVPRGAIPKDGPSAGVTMALALTSALVDIPVKKDVVMTGEVTLRGRVLPVGGIKEKVLAAHRSGIKNIVLPKENEIDLKELPKNIIRAMDFIFVETMEEIYDFVFPVDIREGTK